MRLTNEETGSERPINFPEVAVRGGSGNLGLLPSEPSIHWSSSPSAESGELAHCMVGRLSTPREYRGLGCGWGEARGLGCGWGGAECTAAGLFNWGSRLSVQKALACFG